MLFIKLSIRSARENIYLQPASIARYRYPLYKFNHRWQLEGQIAHSITMHLRSIGLLSAAFILYCGFFSVRAQSPTCYHLDGSMAVPEKNSPCNPDVTGEGDSHSACCNIENKDACMSSGLCLNTLSRQNDHFLWSTGCTDPTMKDPSCPQRCLDSEFLSVLGH